MKSIKLIILIFLLTFSFNSYSNGTLILGFPPKSANVRVGCLYPLSGRNKLYGLDSIEAIKLALKENNNTSLKISVIIENTKSKPYIAAKLANYLIKKYKVNFLCGVVSSAVALTVTKIAKNEKIPFLGTDHSSSRLTIEEFHKYYFRVTNNTLQSMSAGALFLKELKEKLKWKTIAFIGPDYEYGHRAWMDLKLALKSLNIKFKIVGEYWPKLFEPDYTLYIQNLLRNKPDILINAHWGQDLVAFLRQAKNFGLLDKVIFCNFDTGGNYEVMASLQSELPSGLILGARHYNNWPQTKDNINFVNSFFKQTNRYPSYVAHGAYAGIKVIFEVLKKVKHINNKEEIIKALEHLKIKLPKDPDNFTSFFNPKTHQIMQVIALGETVPNFNYPPATRMLGNWKIYYPTALEQIINSVRNKYLTQNVNY
ncbi:amino acid ABC transporter substrate-binding protein [Deferribacter autotrophicus]|uniref:Amino acid ABC transporter substrate-binding protein n=1 Tax=Deferribacter autotrophicus TaxID=500465 RepID=A0A5A8F5F4_9BACT|nr:ABC transporter substrate-binding protein [Deferribacter autotrophicus]KAA0256859.1 amino acid ABC transporter substrate-binding protein [Deferribacter autotrophicus]